MKKSECEVQQAMHFMSFALFISYLKDHLCEKKEKTRKQMKNINNTQCKRLNRWIFSYFQ